MLLVDAANVVGSRPDGWWRDRPGAAQRLVERVRAAVEAGVLTPPVVVVLEGQARAGVEEGDEAGVAVLHAPADGDDAIAAAATTGATVVTADRALAARARAAGAVVVGPRWLLDALDTLDP